MKVSRRAFSKDCAIAAASLAIVEALPALAQVEGERINTSPKHPVPSIQDTESPAEKNERMRWFREARFGMFIHWGLYAIPAGRWNGKEVPGIGEWIMNRASIPVADYKALAPKFDPTSWAWRNPRG
jgi:alpha-L-fucosidase